MVATMLIFAVGVVKYAEKIWALARQLDDIRSSLNNSQVQDDSKIIPEGIHGMYEDQEVLEIAHSSFTSASLLVDSSVTMKRHQLQYYDLGWAKTWKLMAMELSLLYDILYTKASVTHTRTGYIVRFAAPPAIAAALALFQLHLMMTSGGTDGHKHRRVDAAITYVPLAGAFFMEVTALLGAIGST
ncbi:hypothetical protein ZWY2020_046170 [Hordeum vulgare]|nr:hypothetical protein ZWY2020_046170 [Hordeum vulgare]